MYLADQLNNNATVKASGLSGRGYVAEVARILRGADILKEDARLNAEGIRQLDEAKIAMKEAKDLFKQGKMKEARKKEKEAKNLQKEGIEFFDRDIDENKEEYDLFVEITKNDMVPSLLIIEGDGDNYKSFLYAPETNYDELTEAVQIIDIHRKKMGII
jgi:hypothetical protein